MVTKYKQGQLDAAVAFVDKNPGAKTADIAAVLGLTVSPYFRVHILVRLLLTGRVRRELCGHPAKPFWRYYTLEENHEMYLL